MSELCTMVSKILNISMLVYYNSDKDEYTVTVNQFNPLIKDKSHTFEHDAMQMLVDLLQLHPVEE